MWHNVYGVDHLEDKDVVSKCKFPWITQAEWWVSQSALFCVRSRTCNDFDYLAILAEQKNSILWPFEIVCRFTFWQRFFKQKSWDNF